MTIIPQDAMLIHSLSTHLKEACGLYDRHVTYITSLSNLNWQMSIHTNLLPGLGQVDGDDLSLRGQLLPCTYPLLNEPDDF